MGWSNRPKPWVVLYRNEFMTQIMVEHCVGAIDINPGVGSFIHFNYYLNLAPNIRIPANRLRWRLHLDSNALPGVEPGRAALFWGSERAPVPSLFLLRHVVQEISCTKP
jgi:hypothetical protein